MRLGIVSDTHGDARVWEELLAGPLADVEAVCHAGDLLYHGPRNPFPPGYDPEKLAAHLNACRIPVFVARGNCDADVDQLLLDLPIQSPYVYLAVEGLRLLINHGDTTTTEQKWELARRYRVHIFAFGHTHEPFLEHRAGTILLNPGSPALPKGDGTPTVAVVDREGVRILDVRTGRVYRELAIKLPPG